MLTAGVPKTGSSLTGARTIVDMLEFAGLLEETDGTFRARTTPSWVDVRASDRGEGSETQHVTIRPGTSATLPAESVPAGMQRNVVLNIHLWVNARDSNLRSSRKR